MSNSRHMAKTIDAWRMGRPTAKGSTKLVPLAPIPQVAFVAFVRMGGESVPWGMAIKPANERAPVKCFVTPDPRKRTELALTLREFGRYLCKWLGQTSPQNGWPHPQIWVPNESHLEMLHGVALRYVWTKFNPEGMTPRHSEELREMGRAANWLFYESQHPGQTVVVSAADALRSAYYFPTDAIRQAHLGFLLAWLETIGGKAEREAAAELAEQESISPTLNPHIENSKLEKLVQKYGDQSSSGKIKQNASIEITKIIEAELVSRIALSVRAYKGLKNDERSENAGFSDLADKSKKRMDEEYLKNEQLIRNGEDAYIPNPDTDQNPRKAAEIYIEREKSNSTAEAKLLPFDTDLQEIAVASGEAIKCFVSDIREAKILRSRVITWVVECDIGLPLRLRIGDSVSVNGLPSTELRVTNIDTKNERRVLTMTVISPKTSRGGLDMASNARRDKEHLFLSFGADIPLFRKITNLRSRDTKGAWIADVILKKRKRDA